VIEALERFVLELRGAGLSVSPAEWIDGLRAAEAVGLADRERLRQALGCTLAKRARQQPVFDEVFARFFATPGRGRARRATEPGARAGRPAAAPPASAPPQADAPAPGRRPGEAARTPAIAEQLRQTIEQVRDGKPRRFGRLRHVVVGPAGPGPDERLAQDLRALRRAPRRQDPRERLRRLPAEAEREIAAELPRLVDQIRLRTSRRARRASRGRPYPRRAFRENLRHDGVPFVLPRRRQPRKRSRVVLLIDVSWSTASAAGLFLALAHAFLRRARDRRVLFFVDRAVDATTEVARWLERGARAAPQVPFARVVESLAGLDLQAPSDYGRAFHKLLGAKARPRGRDTLLVVLGDGRTNRFAPQDWAFEELAEGCGAVLWIVPEPVARWGTGDSALGLYLRHAHVAVEAPDLAGLARAVAELVRRL
jgi:uncharacterized protein with von Willebrand factor type A (vWA) domain